MISGWFKARVLAPCLCLFSAVESPQRSSGVAAGLIFPFQCFNHGIEVGVAGAEAAREPVSSTPGNEFAIRENSELAGITGDLECLHPEALLDLRRETRGFRAIVPSSGAMDDLDLHAIFMFRKTSR